MLISSDGSTVAVIEAGLMIGIVDCFAEATLASMHATGFRVVLSITLNSNEEERHTSSGLESHIGTP